VGKKDIVEIYDQYVKLPSDVVLSPIITEITGIRRQTLDKNGLDILKVLKAFYEAVLKADVIVAHNMEFDFTVFYKTRQIGSRLTNHRSYFVCFSAPLTRSPTRFSR
jgi:DNA polymerase III epsilon subunit-like protein